MKSTKNPGKEPDKGDVQNLLKRQSPKFISDYILNGSTKWDADTAKEETLNYNLKFGVEAKQKERVKRFTAEHSLFNFENMNGEFAVAHSASKTRVECLGKSIHGSDFIYISDKKNGFTYLDKASKTYIRMPNDRKSGHQYKEKLKGRVELVKENDGKSTKAHLIIEQPQKLKYVLTIDTDKKWQAYSSQVITMILGGADRYSQAGLDLSPLTKAGLPVAGEVYMQTRGDEWSLMTSFKISKLSLNTDSKKLFDIPDGYQDLVEINKKHKKEGRPNAFAPAVRLSDVRKRQSYPDGTPVEDDLPENPLNNTTSNNNDNTGFSAKNFDMPTCFPETYGALLANLVDEKLLDDIKFFGNAITKRLSGFNGSSGNLNIDWMSQFQSVASALGDTDAGSGLFTLLHDETPTDASHPQKLGLLDKLAVTNLSNLLAEGNSLLELGFMFSNPALQSRIIAMLANPSVAAVDRFTSFSLPDQGLLVDAYVFKIIGTIKLDYPDSTGTQSVFYGLLNVRVDNIEFDVKINNKAVIDTFAFDSDSIHLAISLPEASGKAWTSRWPTAKYWGLVGISVIACFLFPFTCFLMGMAVLVGLFIGLDLAYVSLKLSDIKLDSHIRLQPNAANVLQPDVDLTLDADVSAFYMSVIPTGVHQILSLIYDIILNATDIIINTIESQLKDGLNKYLKDDLKITYPPAFGPVTLSGVSNAVEFVALDRGYVEQALDAGIMGIINPYITQVDSNVKPNIIKLRDEFKAGFKDPVTEFTDAGLLTFATEDLSGVARYYLGTVLSQNFINDYIYTLWRKRKYNYNFTPAETEKLFDLIKPAFVELTDVVYDSSMMAHLWPAVPPRTLFTPKPASEGDYYSTTFFDDVRICFELRKKDKKDKLSRLEFAFAAQAFTEIGFGGLDTTTGKLDLLKLSDRLFDIYFDLKTVGIKIIHTEVQYFVKPGMEPKVEFDYSPLNVLQEMFEEGLTYSLKEHNSTAIPRNATDPQYIQRYPLGTDAVQVVFQLVPFRGNLYVSKGISGVATAALEGALDLDTFDRFTARLILAVM